MAHPPTSEPVPTAARGADRANAVAAPACLIPVWGALLLGAGLRIAGLGHKPLWEDEGWTYYVTTSPQRLLALVGLDPHPLTFYWLARCTGEAFTASTWLFRTPAAAFSILGLVGWAGAVAMLRLEKQVQRWCVLLFAVIPLNVCYAQEARAYSLIQALGIGCLLAYAWARRRSGWGPIGVLFIAAAASCHLDGFGLAIPCGLLVHAAWEARRSRKARRLLWGLVAGASTAIPYYIFRVTYLLQAGEVHSLPALTESPPLLLIERLVAVSPFGVTQASLDRTGHAALILVSLGVLTLGLLVVGLVGRTTWYPRRARTILALCLLPQLALLLASAIVTDQDTLEKRYFVPLVPGFVGLFVLGYLRVARLVPLSAYVLLLVAPLTVSALWLSKPTARSSSDWRGLYQAVAPELQPGDGLLNERFANYPFHASSPLRAYARMENRAIPSAQWHEYVLLAQQRRRGASASADDAHFDRLQQRDLLKFLSAIPSGRVWALSSELTLDRTLDLEPYAERLQTQCAPGLTAALWHVRPAIVSERLAYLEQLEPPAGD